MRQSQHLSVSLSRTHTHNYSGAWLPILRPGAWTKLQTHRHTHTHTLSLSYSCTHIPAMILEHGCPSCNQGHARSCFWVCFLLLAAFVRLSAARTWRNHVMYESMYVCMYADCPQSCSWVCFLLLTALCRSQDADHTKILPSASLVILCKCATLYYTIANHTNII